MAATFPLPLAALSDLLPVNSVEFNLEHRQEISGTGSGLILAADVSDPLWMPSVECVRLRNSASLAIESAIDLLDGSIGTFLLANPRRPHPAADPTGSILGSNTVTILANQNGKEIKLQGLPSGYVLTPGDHVAWDFGSVRVFHRIVTGATADGAGETGWMELRPHLIPTSAAVDTEVILKKPAMVARIVPGTLSGRRRNGQFVDGISFQAVQVL